jgi:hypothetical protein
MDASGSTDEVDNGVDRADLMEVNGLDGDAVEFGLGLGHALEHGEGGVADPRIEFGFFQKITDFRPVAAVMVIVVMMMVVVGLLDQEPCASQAAADGPFGPEDDFFREVEGANGFLKQGEGNAQIEEGGAEHVPADPGRAAEMEMGRRHGVRID